MYSPRVQSRGVRRGVRLAVVRACGRLWVDRAKGERGLSYLMKVDFSDLVQVGFSYLRSRV